MIGSGVIYLTENSLCLNGVVSDIGNISCGVPQGSNLGPLLFLIYINDIGNSVPGLSVIVDRDQFEIWFKVYSMKNISAEVTAWDRRSGHT